MNDTKKIREIMADFADRTSLTTSSHAPKRYLWTDAFAVCNFLELFLQTGEEQYKQDAFALVDQVHSILGTYRDDDPRSGWISNLEEENGKLHPTAGGLRIGKKLNERQADEPYNDRLEWDQDGQDFHYLTKWMHALNRVGQVSNNLQYNRWALELAKTAHAQFTYTSLTSQTKQMYWKMSIDLSRPLVSSMGQHDALDGLITYLFPQQQLLISQLADFSPHLPLMKKITMFWLTATNQQSNTWTEHIDINSIMLATTLGPDGYLMLR